MLYKVGKEKIMIGAAIVVCLVIVALLLKPEQKGPAVIRDLTISGITAQEIKDWAGTIDSYPEFDRLARERYYGKAVEWDGVVGSVSPSASGAGAYVSLVSPRFVAQFNDKNKVIHLKKGDRVTVRGKISGISKFGVGGMTTTLKDCSLATKG